MCTEGSGILSVKVKVGIQMMVGVNGLKSVKLKPGLVGVNYTACLWAIFRGVPIRIPNPFGIGSDKSNLFSQLSMAPKLSGSPSQSSLHDPRRHVGIHREHISNISSTDYPGHYPNEDNSWDLTKFKNVCR